MPSFSRFDGRYGAVSGAILVLWIVGAFVFVPRIIGDAYAGDSLQIFNAALSGRDVHPLAFYQGLWLRIAWLGLGGLAVGAIVLWAAIRRWARIREGARRLVRADPTASIRDALWLGVAAGLVAGYAQGTIHYGRSLFGFGANLPSVDAIWLAGIPGALSGAILAAAIVLLLGYGDGLRVRSNRPVSFRIVALVLSAFALYSALVPIPRVHTLAKLALATGAGVQISALLTARWVGVRRWLRPVTLVLAAMGIGLGAGLPTTRWVQESLVLARTPRAAPGAPNVLLIILDTVRAKSMSLYGYQRPTTPEIDDFARRGVVFDAAFSTAPWTLPSHASMFTGRWPYQFTGDWTEPFGDTHPTLAEALTAGGYATGGFVANYAFTTRRSGLSRGFLHYVDHSPSWQRAVSSFWVTRGSVEAVRRWLGIRRRLVRKRGEVVNREFLAWADRQDRPFFAFLNYFDAHDPYEQNEPYTRFWDETPPYWAVRNNRTPSPQELVEFQKAYDGTLTYLDHQIGRLLDQLEERDILENTLVIITSDHGEQFGEHGLHLHSNSLYLPVLRVPLIVVLPEGVPAERRVPTEVSIRDIAATILEVAGMDRSRFGGSPLSRFWSPTGEPAGMVLAQASRNVFSVPGSPVRRGSMSALFYGGFHYILNGDGAEELYRWTTDPDELGNLAGSAAHAAELNCFRQELAGLWMGGDPPLATGNGNHDGDPALTKVSWTGRLSGSRLGGPDC
jgi:arylsulfatase A-like enzyme